MRVDGVVSRNIEIMNVGYTGLTNRAEQLNRTGINQTKIHEILSVHKCKEGQICFKYSTYRIDTQLIMTNIICHDHLRSLSGRFRLKFLLNVFYTQWW